MDFHAGIVRKGEEQVRLTRTEFTLITLLVRNAGKMLTHGYILEQLRGAGCTEDTEYLRVYAGHLRKKPGDDPGRPVYILTAAGIGYGRGIVAGPLNSKEFRNLPSSSDLRHPPGLVTP